MKRSIPTSSRLLSTSSVVSFALSAVASLGGCGSEPVSLEAQLDAQLDGDYQFDDTDAADIREAGLEQFEQVEEPDELVQEVFSLTAQKSLYCPEGFSYDATISLCASTTEAIGPFPQAMVDKCEEYGGGSACEKPNWSKSFAASIRGRESCLLGTWLSETGLCTDGENAYGPFSIEHVENCEANGGGSACSSLRWSLSFAKWTQPEGKTENKQLAGLDLFIDSGHGGNPRGWEPGAVNPFNRMTEYQLNLETAQAVQSALEAAGARVTLAYYPTDFSGPSLSSKGARAENHDVFVSIHHNAADGNAQGSEVFVHNSLQTRDDQKLAFAIQKRLVDVIWNGAASKNRGVKAANFGVLRGAAPVTRAAVLVECFFMDHNESKTTLLNRKTKCAQAIGEGVANYWLSR